MAKTLPNWLSIREDGAFVVDPNIAYPQMMTAMGFDPKDAGQYEVECAYQGVKRAVQDIVDGTDLDPRSDAKNPRGLVIVIDASDDRKNRWRLANLKQGEPGRDIHAATKGQHAKRRYQEVKHRFLAR
jgi:hypothetical protein